MSITPNEVYENYRNSRIDITKTIDLLISLIENIDNDKIRKESIEILNKLNFNHSKVFKVLESILISDENENLRYSAAKVIKSKFLEKGLKPLLWALQHESSYNCLLIIIKSLAEIRDDRISASLINEIKRIEVKGITQSLFPILVNNKCDKIPDQILAEILINYITIKHLKSKFDRLEFKIEEGYVTELDFSNVDNLTVYWRDRYALQDHSDILGIKNLSHLKDLRFFSLKWIFNNEFTYMSSLALIQAIERINKNIAKTILFSQLNNIDDEKFKFLLKDRVKKDNTLKSLSLSKLSDIFRNYLTISFLKLKYPSVKYKVKDSEIIEIQMKGDSLITIPEYFKYFRSLQSLILKRCKIYTLPEFIGSFSNLEILDLEGNNLNFIPRSISSLQSLKLLNLSDNQLEKVPYSIGTLSSLQHLDLSNNKLKEIPRSIGYLHSLKTLKVEMNILRTIPSSIGSLKYLQLLNLSSNRLNELPRSIGLLNSLEQLILTNNKLSELPSSINSISTLKILNIEDNNLSYLPETIELLKSLEILKLGWNKLEKLPKSIGALITLKSLHLTNNKLKKLPSSICSLSLLTYLDTSLNKIKILPKAIGKLKSLKVLKMGDNQLEELPESICFLGSLEVLNICENRINYIPESIAMLKSLKQLWLNGNKLCFLPKSIGKLSSLEKLNLNNNQLIALPKSIKKVKNLEEITLNYSHIKNIFDYPINSNKFRLDKNLNSDCSKHLISKFESYPKLTSSNIVFDIPFLNEKLTD
ncbi:MAG: hypothetical protein ACFFB0_07560 [Promethearchaeota archaeon]